MLPKVSKIQYQDSIHYTDSQDFKWTEISEYTSSYSGNETRMQAMMRRYKEYVYIRVYTNQHKKEDESESSCLPDDDLKIVFRYMRALPKRIRKIVQFKIISPEISSTRLAKKIGINRDTLYQDFKWIRSHHPELLFFTCPGYRNNRHKDPVV